MKKIISLLLCAFIVGELCAQSDPVLMTVAGRKVYRSEFEYSLNKNTKNVGDITKDDIRNYVGLYVDYRLKVQAALDAQLDTLSSFNKEYRQYRDAQLKSYVYDSLYADSVGHVVYDALKESVGDSDIVLLSHIFLRVPQNSDAEFADKQKNIADSLYLLLNSGADFADLARRFSQDKYSAYKGGQLSWIGPAQMMPEFQEVVYTLSPGKYSKPFLSPAGYHIVYMHSRKRFGSYEEMREEIINELNERGLKEDAAERQIVRLVSESNGTLTREDVLLKVQADAEKLNPNLKYLLGEFYDGLLLYEATNRMVWQKAVEDEKGQNAFFERNKGKYKWNAPHFRGFVIRARSMEMLKRIASVVKKCKSNEGLALLKEKLPADTLKFINVHFGVYKNGDNPIVDYEIFKSVDSVKNNKLMPFFKAVGKKYKQPKNVIDVKSEVVSDYQNSMEKEWIKELRLKYKYSVDENVLSTVNNH